MADLGWICGKTRYSETVVDKIDSLIEQQLPHATLGVLVKNA